MKLDTLLLVLAIVGGVPYFGAIIFGLFIATPAGIAVPLLIVVAIIGYVLWRVIAERRANAEDDYYERNVEK